MHHLPFYISITFVLTTLLALWLFYRATRYSKVSLLLVLAWLALQGIVGITGFYTVTDTLPPRFALLLMPPVFFILMLFVTAKGRTYVDSLDIKALTLLHIVRIPVEMVLFWLCMQKAVPQLLTFEGRNFDVFSGLTAPFIYYFGFVKGKLGNGIILAWNFLCLALLVNVVVNAVLSGPFVFQRFAFDQPNVAILYFPFVWLPGFVVPAVLLSHLAVIRRLSTNRNRKEA